MWAAVRICDLIGCTWLLQVLQAKKRLLDSLHAEVASSEDGKLKRMLIEDETTLKRREQCTHRLNLLKKAADELSAASY